MYFIFRSFVASKKNESDEDVRSRPILMGVIVDELCDDTSMNAITVIAVTSNILHVITDLAVCLSVNDVTNGNIAGIILESDIIWKMSYLHMMLTRSEVTAE
jgi:hypothetical protein